MNINDISQITTALNSSVKIGSGTSNAKGSSFSDILKDSINEVNSLQKDADKALLELAAGKSKNIHETMLAIEKAGISFRLMMQVRNKIVEAYQEISRMSV